MTIREMVVSDFQEFILMDPSVPNDLRNSLRVKERAPLFIDNLVGQIKHIEVVKPGIKLDRQKIKMMVYDMTKMYVHLLKTKAEEMHMSDVAKSAAVKALEDPILNKFDKDGNADLTEEFGVVIKDKVPNGSQ